MAHELFEGRHGGRKGPDQQDSRDWLFAHAVRAGRIAPPLQRPASVTLEADLPPVYDQGQLGSCTAFATRTMREFLSRKVKHPSQPLSPLWLYYETRSRFYPDEVGQDSGAYLRDAVAILRGRGMAREVPVGDDVRPTECWPYDISKFTVKPPSPTFGPALWYKNVNSYRLQTLNEMLDCLAAGYCFVLGFDVYQNFYDAEGTGRVPMPSGSIVGGHAQCAFGYALSNKWAGGGYILTRNSWGSGPTGFTPNGDLMFPFDYMSTPRYASDFWAVHLLSEDAAAQP
jgi:hypothetical protein